MAKSRLCSGQKPASLAKSRLTSAKSRLPLARKPALLARSRLTPAYAGFPIVKHAEAGLRRLTPALTFGQNRSRLTPANAGFFGRHGREAGGSRPKPALFRPKKPAFGQKRAGFWPKAGSFLSVGRHGRKPASFGQSRLPFGQKEAGFWPGKAGSFWPGKEPAYAGFRRLPSVAPKVPVRHCGDGPLGRLLVPERCRFGAASRRLEEVLRETLSQRPTETGKPAKAVFYRVSRVGKSRLLPAFAVPAGFGQKRPISPKVGAGPFRGARDGLRGRFLDEKRGFLTGNRETLSVLFGTGSGSSRSRIPSCSGTPSEPARLRSALFYPLFRPKPAKTGQKSSGKVANIQPFCRLSDGKTTFWSPFGHLLVTGSDSGGPTHWFREESDGGTTSLSCGK